MKAVVDAKASKKIGDVKKEASEDKRDADYKVEIETCEKVVGTTKDA